VDRALDQISTGSQPAGTIFLDVLHDHIRWARPSKHCLLEVSDSAVKQGAWPYRSVHTCNSSLKDMLKRKRLDCWYKFVQSGPEVDQRRCLSHRSTLDEGDYYGPLQLGDVLLHSLKEASCAPLELAAAALAGLGSLLARSKVCPVTLMSVSIHTACLHLHTA
jgi:hypothetical protein